MADYNSVWAINLATYDTFKVTPVGLYCLDLYIEGDTLVFIGNAEMFIVDLTSRKLNQLTENTEIERMPRYKNDHVVFVREVCIVLMELSTGIETPIRESDGSKNSLVILDAGIFWSEYLDHYYQILFYPFESLSVSDTTIVVAGWNLLSYPFNEPVVTDFVDFIPDYILDPVYGYNNISQDYVEADSLSSAMGYWFFSVEDSIIKFSDIEPVDSVSLELYPGWNLIGGPYRPIPSLFFGSYPDILSTIYGYNPVERDYYVADTIRAKKGYWLFSMDTLEILLR